MQTVWTRSEQTECRSWDTLIVFLTEFFFKLIFKKVSRGQQKYEKLAKLPRVKRYFYIPNLSHLTISDTNQ